MKRAELKWILKKVLSQPTAPFLEGAIASVVEQAARDEQAEYSVDAFGNRIIVYRPKGKARKGRIAFQAHMDHPGFEIIEANGKKAAAKWWGGVWRNYFKNSEVVVHDKKPVFGKVVKTHAAEDPKRVDTMELLLEAPVSVGCAGQWKLPAYEMQGTKIITRAADDLCSVAAQLALLKELKRNNVRHEIWLIFTRAEENGFNGSLAMLKDGLIPNDLPIVNLETSKILPGAEQGDGPVIRLGDKISVFSHDLLMFMENCAKHVSEGNPRFRWQRRVMDGGMCEASAFVSYGFKSAGIAFPLGNYHNMSEEKDPKGGMLLKAETVDIRDVENSLRLMVEMCNRLAGLSKTTGELAKRLEKRNRPFYRRLKENPV